MARRPAVRSLDLGVTWEPDRPDSLPVSHGDVAVIALEPHPSDFDRRCVLLVFTRAVWATDAGFNDEGLRAHPLYRDGLADLTWTGVVENSPRVPELARASGVPLDVRHFVVPTKERLFEIVAGSVGVAREPGSTGHAGALLVDPFSSAAPPPIR